jgi:hypothetical protein
MAKLVDQYGHPIRSSFFEAGSITARREHDWTYYYGNQDTEALQATGDPNLILSAARSLFANNPILRGALLEQADYSFPLIPHYTGADTEWGKIAGEYIAQWQKVSNWKGAPYDSHLGSRLRLLGRKVDGDILTILLRTPGGWPQVQFVRAHRIWSRENDAPLKAGPFEGKISKRGIIYDDYGRPLAFELPGETEDEDRWISRRDAFLTFRPDYSDTDRGISELMTSIRSFDDIKTIFKYELRAHKIFATQSLIEHNESGSADEAQDALDVPPAGTNTRGTASGLTVEVFDEGQKQYFRSNTGSGLTAFQADRPSSDVQAWWDRIISHALYGIRWDPNFALAIKEPGGAWARTILQKINFAITENQNIEAAAQKREIGWALNVGMNDRLIPRPKDGDWYSWQIIPGVPALTADSGNDQAAIREALKMGLTTQRAIYSGQGKYWETEGDQRQIEIRRTLIRAREIQKEFPELTLQDCLQLFEQRNPNASPMPPEEPAAPAPKKA